MRKPAKFSILFRNRHKLAIPISILALLVFVPIAFRSDSKNQTASLPDQNIASKTVSNKIKSNQLLIKFKKEAKSKIKGENHQDTGLASVDKTFKESKVKNFKRIARVGKKSKTDATVFSWYLVELDQPGKDIDLSKSSSTANKPTNIDIIRSADLGELGKIKAKLEKDPNVETVEFNQVVTAFQDPSSRVFATSNTYTGNLGGLSGADNLCQSASNTAGLGGTWKAWLSDSANSASSRFYHSTGPYKLINSTTIATSWADLTDGTLLNKININENGEDQYNIINAAWTGTDIDGSSAANGFNCSNWTSASSVSQGQHGALGAANSYWTKGADTYNLCNNKQSLYCFEQLGSPSTPQPTPTPSSTVAPTSTPAATPAPTPLPSYPPGVPNDPYYQSSGSWGQTYADLWGLKKINSESGWVQATGSASLVVASIDTGVDRNHPDIASNMWVNQGEIPNNSIDDDGNGYIDDYLGFNFITNTPDPIDDNGHGTHTAGTIAAVGNNGIGVVGVNWSSKIMALKFLDAGGRGYTDDAIRALVYAADMGAKVSSNSWGGGYNAAVNDAIRYEHDKGMVIVVAAGNSATDAINYSPSSAERAITVAASDSNDQIASFSNNGPKIDIAAPGVDILSLKSASGSMCDSTRTVGTNYCRVSGTSMATPHVAGLVALLLSKNPNLTNEEVRQIIRNSTADLGSAGRDNVFGYGRIEVGATLSNSSNKPLTVLITQPTRLTSIGIGSSGYQILGTVSGPNFSKFKLELGLGRTPIFWTQISSSGFPVQNGLLALLDSSVVPSGRYTLRLTATDTLGKDYQFEVYDLIIGTNPPQVSGWPQTLDTTSVNYTSPAHADLDGDGKDELVVAYMTGASFPPDYLNIAAWHADGSRVTGFPITTNIQVGDTKVTLADLDKDGKAEILVDTYQGIYAYNGNGTLRSGFPVGTTEKFEYAQVVAKDLNGDGYPEIIAGTRDTGNLYVWDHSGNLLPGWPKNMGSSYIWSIAATANQIIVSSTSGSGTSGEIAAYNLDGAKAWAYPIDNNAWISVGDLDSDGKLETVFYKDNTSYDSASNPTGQIVGILDNYGQLLRSFPAGPYRLHFGLVLGDVDSDGKLEIAGASGTRDGHVFLWHQDGSLVSGWPKTVTENVYIPMIADVNGDGKNDVITSLSNSRYSADPTGNQSIDYHTLYAWNGDGSDIAGWPKKIFAPNVTGSVNGNLQSDILDLDKNGTVDLAVGIAESGVFVLDLQNTYNKSKVEWGSYRHDAQRGGVYTSVRTPQPTPLPDTTAPTTTITSPVNGATVVGVINITADATDDVAVKQVEFSVDGVVKSTQTTSPYSLSFDTTLLTNGSHSISVKATDTSNNVSYDTVAVTVANADTTPPTAPTSLVASAVSPSQINLSWLPAADNIDVTDYQVFRNNVLIATVSTLSFGDTGLTASTTYSYFVKAQDAAGNISPNSNAAQATTQAPATTGDITGTVFSSAGGAIPGANVVITVNGFRKTYTADSKGVYNILNLKPGTYILKYSARHFSSLSSSINVVVGQTITKNITLQKK